MKFGSVCSGIEAASVAWSPLGWKAAWLSEIEPFPSAVLAHHYPDVPNLGDMTALPDRIRSGDVEAPDVFCGGTPCQAFSVAGLRKSLDDARGNLSLVFCEIANAIDDVRSDAGEQPTIIFWENVPGVLSTKDNAFGCFLGELAGEDCAIEPPGRGGRWSNAGAVYGPKRAIAWRVLDAQYFGVAQRRRRVFVVASARADIDPATILFEFDGLRRDTAPRRETGKEVAGTISSRTTGGGGLGTDFECAGGLQPVEKQAFEVANCLTARMHKGINTTIDEGQTPVIAFDCKASGQNGFGVAEEVASTMRSMSHTNSHANGGGHLAVAVSLRGREGGATAEIGDEVQNCLRASNGGGDKAHVLAPVYTTKLHNTQSNNAGKLFEERSPCLDANSPAPALLTPMAVRRLTPVECERLQGFPAVSEKAIIEVCLDQQNQGALAALKCHKWQNSVWPADVSWLTQPASIAVARSSTNQADPEPLAAINVQLLYGHTVRVTRNAGRSILYASGAESFAKYHQSTQIENTAVELAPLLHELVNEALNGRVELHRSIRLSFPALSGETNAEKSGQGTEGRASDAESDQKQATFTTSDLGLITTSSDLKAATLCCSALRAIAGCIPSETLPETFSIELTVETPYTAIPWRNKAASECPDGPRYKALGNSWAVPVVRWIGQRIQLSIEVTACQQPS